MLRSRPSSASPGAAVVVLVLAWAGATVAAAGPTTMAPLAGPATMATMAALPNVTVVGVDACQVVVRWPLPLGAGQLATGDSLVLHYAHNATGGVVMSGTEDVAAYDGRLPYAVRGLARATAYDFRLVWHRRDGSATLHGAAVRVTTFAGSEACVWDARPPWPVPLLDRSAASACHLPLTWAPLPGELRLEGLRLEYTRSDDGFRRFDGGPATVLVDVPSDRHDFQVWDALPATTYRARFRFAYATQCCGRVLHMGRVSAPLATPPLPMPALHQDRRQPSLLHVSLPGSLAHCLAHGLVLQATTTDMFTDHRWPWRRRNDGEGGASSDKQAAPPLPGGSARRHDNGGVMTRVIGPGNSLWYLDKQHEQTGPASLGVGPLPGRYARLRWSMWRKPDSDGSGSSSSSNAIDHGDKEEEAGDGGYWLHGSPTPPISLRPPPRVRDRLAGHAAVWAASALLLVALALFSWRVLLHSRRRPPPASAAFTIRLGGLRGPGDDGDPDADAYRAMQHQDHVGGDGVCEYDSDEDRWRAREPSSLSSHGPDADAAAAAGGFQITLTRPLEDAVLSSYVPPPTRPFRPSH